MSLDNYIPIVDFSPLSEKNGRVPTQEDWEGIKEKLYKAMSEVGFVYLINHDIDRGVVEKSFEQSKNFFELPLDVKLVYKKNPSTGLFCGYSAPNQERFRADAYELRESFDYSSLNSNANIPETPSFQESLFKLKNECKPLVTKILKLFAKAVEEEENFFVDLSTNLQDERIPSYSTFRTLYYPRVSDEVKFKPGLVRCNEHTDYGILTLLFQDDIGGLEVKTVDGNWVPANPIPGSILINTGDMLEFWTGGRFPATAHRVLIPEIELKKQIARQSIAYFIHPDDTAIVAPLKSAGSSKFKPISAYEHGKMRIESNYY